MQIITCIQIIKCICLTLLHGYFMCICIICNVTTIYQLGLRIWPDAKIEMPGPGLTLVFNFLINITIWSYFFLFLWDYSEPSKTNFFVYFLLRKIKWHLYKTFIIMFMNSLSWVEPGLLGLKTIDGGNFDVIVAKCHHTKKVTKHNLTILSYFSLVT